MLGHHAYRPGVLYLPRYTILTVFIAMAGIMWAKVHHVIFLLIIFMFYMPQHNIKIVSFQYHFRQYHFQDLYNLITQVSVINNKCRCKFFIGQVYGFRQKVPARGLCLWCEHKSPRKMSVKEGDNVRCLYELL